MSLALSSAQPRSAQPIGKDAELSPVHLHTLETLFLLKKYFVAPLFDTLDFYSSCSCC